MKIVAFAAQKGGVGKTTAAVNLAVAAQLAGLQTAIFDMDPQESATAWADLRLAEDLHVEPMSARRLPAALEAARAAGFALAIIDTPPAAGDQAAEAVSRADLALIPCRPSLPDLQAIKRTAQLIASTGTRGLVLMNAAPPTATQLLADAKTLAEATGLQVARPVLRERSAYRAAWPSGQGVTEYEPNGKAAGEIDSLLNFVLDCLQISKPAKRQNKKVA